MWKGITKGRKKIDMIRTMQSKKKCKGKKAS